MLALAGVSMSNGAWAIKYAKLNYLHVFCPNNVRVQSHDHVVLLNLVAERLNHESAAPSTRHTFKTPEASPLINPPRNGESMQANAVITS
jgi:hypothetical protein